jgi:tetratricopeptide (TPR) repeat protein
MKEVTDKDRGWDASNYRRGQALIRNPLTEAEILLIKAGNESTRKNYARSIEMYGDAFKKAGSNTDIQARALYSSQQVMYDAELFTEALETSKTLVAIKPVAETWITPHAWFKLGQVYGKLKRIADARLAFAKVIEYDDYEYQSSLEDRVKDELKKLDRGDVN